ncbi:MAG: Gfo/Idh/MocA family oxidoreductase [Gammaproteobacteria bacterium]|nr:Gfo/Idh/MocA family oxidoreductase [Gammaproteobacteria bacterium]
MLDGKFSMLVLRLLMFTNKKCSDRICIVGLGNHGFTLIAFFVCVHAKKRISLVIDPSVRSKKLAERVLKCRHFNTVQDAIEAGEFYGSIAYIASDHMSHTEHALEAVNRFSAVYVEKPLFVDFSQAQSFRGVFDSDSKVFTGFNRPRAPFSEILMRELGAQFSVSMIVNGHHLGPDHWYRADGQGTRVLGNLTHWLDLSVRLLSVHGLPSSVNIRLVGGVGDDLSVTLTSPDNKIDLLFSANCEPSDGVEEFIHWNSTSSIGRILNFQSITGIRVDRTKFSVKNWSKNVGHQNAVLAPIIGASSDAQVSYISSLLALKIEQMYVESVSDGLFEFDFGI